MAVARNTLVDLETTPYYHCMARCVRRAFLCGKDSETGKSFDHRKKWIVDRLKMLADVFAVDICAYAIMSNHYHVVVHVDKALADGWTDEEVRARWAKIFPADAMSVSTSSYENKAQEALANKKLMQWRDRLADISWFMRCVNEFIARRANKEDRCKGRFWEGRFKCQSLLDESALLTCMAYVDLNPIRAGIATDIESSEFTSIYERIAALQSSRRGRKPRKRKKHEQFQSEQYDSTKKIKQPESIARLNVLSNEPEKESFSISYDLLDYLSLLTWTSQAVRKKSTTMPEALRAKLEKCNINSSHWVNSVENFSKNVFQFLGSEEKLSELQSKGVRKKIKGLAFSRYLYNVINSHSEATTMA